jgi:hypothetical protein
MASTMAAAGSPWRLNGFVPGKVVWAGEIGAPVSRHKSAASAMLVRIMRCAS